METAEFDRILKHTLADFRLSRGEKKVLRKTLAELAPSDQQLSFLRHRAFEVARQELLGPDAVSVVDWLEEVVKVIQPGQAQADPKRATAYFSPGDNCAVKISNMFQTAQRQVDICVFTITDDRIREAILAAHGRNIEVRIVSDNDKAHDVGSDVDFLARRGVPVRVDRSEYHMHHKFALFDNQHLLTGSYNWTRSAARYNAENFVVTEDPDLVREFSREFQQLWDKLA